MPHAPIEGPTVVAVNPATSAEARILTSAAFRRARLRASTLVASRRELAALLCQVERKRDDHAPLREGGRGLDLDIICSVVEACVEGPGCERAVEADATSITGKARLRLVVAALVYLVEVEDVIPDRQPNGLTDDCVLLRWASRMARAELPAA